MSDPQDNSVDSADISGVWSGQYWYNDTDLQIPSTVPFTATFFDNDGKLSGTTLEPNTFVISELEELCASINGARQDSHIQFVKMYDDVPGADDYIILYTGEINETCDHISGGWLIEESYAEASGGFELVRVSGKVAVSRSASIEL